MRKLIVEIDASTDDDIELGLDEVKRLVSEGYTSGDNGNEFGSYTFKLTGTEEAGGEDDENDENDENHERQGSPGYDHAAGYHD